MRRTPTSEQAGGWHVLGAGAMGCLWSAALASAGQRVQLLSREPPEAAVEARLRLERPDGSVLDARVRLPARGDDAPILRLLCCTKAQDLAGALRPLAHRIAAGAAVVLIQNGMGFHDAVLRLVPQARLYCAVTTEGAWRLGPLHVRHAGRGETLLGRWPPAAHDAEDTAALARELGAGPLAVRAVEDVSQPLWRKLAVNCLINPLTALHGCSNGELLSRPALHAEFRALAAETAGVLVALGHADIAASLLHDAGAVARATAANRSSMRQDLEAGRATEIEWITGFLCGQARERGVPCPLNDALLAAVRARTQPR